MKLQELLRHYKTNLGKSNSNLNNQRRLLPLRKFEVTYITSVNQSDVERTDSFTADMHRVEEGRNQFLNTGNVIREYQLPLIRIVVTPIDDAEIPE